MIADIFNFAKMRAVFRGGPKRFGAHPGFPCFCGDRRWLVGFRRGHRNRAIITLFRMLENCYQKELPEAGCDEAGRGCLAGPVFAAAVMLPPDFSHPLLNDSKQMTARQRDLLRAIVEREALAWVVKAVSAERIDQINILNASFEGMSLAVAELPIRPGFLAIDGNRFRTRLEIPWRCIVKGDGKYLSIAAASILAKTWRDEYMERIAQEHPQYDWTSNKGYPTRRHREAIRRFGVTPYHRMSYNLLGDAEPMLPFEEEANGGER